MKMNYNYSKITKLAGGVWRYAMALAAGVMFLSFNTEAQKLGTSFSQYANEPGSEQWIPSALIPNNSQYYEGTSTLQRLVLTNIKPTSGSNPNYHELNFKVLASKGGVNAYDFVTGFDQALQDYVNITGQQITNSGPAPLTTTERFNLVTGTKIPNPATATLIGQLFNGIPARATAPDASFYNSTYNKQSIISAYDDVSYPKFPGISDSEKRGVQLYVKSGFSFTGTPALVFNGYSAPDLSGDSYGLYTLTWESAAPEILILMAGHLATGDNGSPYTGLWHGTNLGASFINGGPYHFKLELLDGISLGNQDNQIQSGAITVFQSSCSLPAAGPVCDGVTTTHTATSTQAVDAQYDWVITGNGYILDGVNPVTSLTTYETDGLSPFTSSVNVLASGAGAYTLSVTISKTGFVTHTCSVTVTVNGNPAAPGTTDVEYCQGETASVLTATGSNLKWYDSGDNLLSGAPTPSTTTAGETTYYVSQTVNGCEGPKAPLKVTIKELPAAPGTSDVDYCKDATASELTATGSNLKWYDSGDNLLSGAPTPSTSSIGTTTYYVSQTVNGCEGPKARLDVNVYDNPAIIDLQIVNPTCSTSTGTVRVINPKNNDNNNPVYHFSFDGGVTYDTVSIYEFQAGAGYTIRVKNLSTGCESIDETCDAEQSNARVVPSKNINEIEEKSLDMIAYPVPFSDKVTLEFTSGYDEEYVINLYDMRGNMVKQLKAGHAKAGELISVEVDGRGMAESIYIARKVSSNGVSTVKLLKQDE